MRRIVKYLVLIIPIAGTVSVWGQSGPYAPPAGQAGSTAMHKDSAVFSSWATSCSVSRGYLDISDTSQGKVTAGSSLSAIGMAAENGVVSLGDGGFATLEFNGFIKNGPGYDFAVFENSFSDTFLELAFVEVSSDGVNYHRFPSVSLTDTSQQVSSFGSLDATEIYNLAGKYRANYGTPFDLQELTGIAGLNTDSITHVRVVDVVGNIEEPYRRYDSQGNVINDPWPTAFSTGGFDLDAVGVVNYISTGIGGKNPDPQFKLFPNPVVKGLNLKLPKGKKGKVYVFNAEGRLMKEKSLGHADHRIVVDDLKNGVYYLKFVAAGETPVVRKFVKARE